MLSLYCRVRFIYHVPGFMLTKVNVCHQLDVLTVSFHHGSASAIEVAALAAWTLAEEQGDEVP